MDPIKWLESEYDIDPGDLEKFSGTEVAKLAKVCKEWSLDPSMIVYKYESVNSLIKNPVSKDDEKTSDLGDLLENPDTVKFIVDQASNHYLGYQGNPLELLNNTQNDYESAKKRIESMVLPKKKQDPRVKGIIEGFQNELHDCYEEQIKGKRIAAVVTGSCYFGDPSTDPDLDADFIVYDESDNLKTLNKRPDEADEKSPIMEIIANELAEFYEDIETHCNVYDLTQIQNRLKKVIDGDYSVITGYQRQAATHFFEDIGRLLTSKPIYFQACNSEEAVKKLQETRDLINQAAEKDPIFRGFLIYELEEITRHGDGKKRPVYENEK
ncbi:hypothetical protein ACFL96_15045 [Thermoproteota archaeon]